MKAAGRELALPPGPDHIRIGTLDVAFNPITPTVKGARVAKLKEPHNRIIRSFDQAVAYCKFGGLTYVLLYEARMASWTQATIQGLDHPLVIRFNLSALAREYECNRKSFEDARDVLLSWRVLVEVNPGEYLINKDPLNPTHPWVDPRTGLSPFTEAQVCELEKSKRSHKKKGDGVYTPQSVGSIHPNPRGSDCDEAGSIHPKPSRSTPQSVGSIHPRSLRSTPHPISPPPRTPPRTRASEEFQKSKKSTEEQQQHSESSSERESIPPYPRDDGPLDIMPGRFPMTREDAEAIWSLLWRTWHSDRLCNGFYEHQQFHQSAHWRSAIRVAYRQGITPQHVRYLERIAGDHEAKGIPAEVALEPDGAQAAPSRAQVKRQQMLDKLKARFGPKEATDGHG